MLQRRHKMKRYSRIFEFKTFSSLVNFTSVYKSTNKCTTTLHKNDESMMIQEKLHLGASLNTKQ